MTKHDGFVSYAHIDDEPLPGALEGWVTTLVKSLKTGLKCKLGRKDVSLWMDHQLAGNAQVTQEIMAAIRDSATLIVIVSQAYLASDWCRREREGFLALVKERVKAGSSVFLVERDEVERRDLPVEFGDLIGYHFWVQEREGEPPRTLGVPVPRPEEKTYYDRLNELSHQLAAEIRRQRSQPGLELKAPETPNGPVIFLAEVTDDLDATREEVKSYLLQAGLRVLPGTWYPRDDPAAFQQSTDRDLAQCKLFAQLLSGVVGRKPPGLSQGYARLQYERALKAGKTILQWRSRDLDLDRIADADHRRLLEVETVRACGIEEFKRAVSADAYHTSHAPPASDNDFVFVNTDLADRPLAGEVSDFLLKHGIGSALPISKGKPADIRGDLQMNLRNCDGLIILYGNTAVTWVRNQLLQSRRVIGQRKQPLRCLALCEAPPTPKDDVAFRLPRMVTLDCRNGLNEEVLLEFIKCLRRR